MKKPAAVLPILNAEVLIRLYAKNKRFIQPHELQNVHSVKSFHVITKFITENIQLSAQLHLKRSVNHVSRGTLMDTLGIRLILGTANEFSNIIILLRREINPYPANV